jgi:hypothetical protein
MLLLEITDNFLELLGLLGVNLDSRVHFCYKLDVISVYTFGNEYKSISIFYNNSFLLIKIFSDVNKEIKN